MSTQAFQKIEDLLESWSDSFNDKKVPAHAVRLADDPIALSWASYHVWTHTPARRWVSLNDVEAQEHDREQARITRRYYRDRLTMLALKGKELTNFQSSLYGLVSGESVLMSDQMGMVMKLPYFYVEDITQDGVFRDSRAITDDRHRVHQTGVIRPTTSYLMSRRSNECYCYWFQDEQGHPVMWAVSTSNGLRSLVDSLHRRGQPIPVRAHWHVQRRSSDRNQLFYHLSNVELAQ